MSVALTRDGIFKARPLSWAVRTYENSQAVAVNMKFSILSQLDGTEWVSWAECEEHVVYGAFFVVKKDGTVNTQAVENLYAALGWEGDLRQVGASPVPDRVVQITVKNEPYQGKDQWKVGWINPEDYTPQPQGASEEDVGRLQARFGSLLRAAAAGAKMAAAKPASGTSKRPPPSTPSAPANPISGAPMADVPVKGDALAFDRAGCVAGLLEESIRSRVKQVASMQDVTVTKASDLERLTDEQLMRLRDAVFDASIPF